MSNLYSLEFEKSLLSGLLQFPEVWGDVATRLKDGDFSKVNAVVYSLLSKELAEGKTVSATILGDKLKSYSVTFEDIEPFEYLNALMLIPVKREEVENLAKEVKKLAYLREQEQRCVDIKAALPGLRDKSFDEITSFIDKKLADTNVYFGSNQTESMFEGMEAEFEQRIAKPPTKPKGYLGPFKSINDTIGPLTYKSSFTVVSSRTGNGKSSLSWYYNTYLAHQYKLPVLHLDCGEMTRDELRERAISSLSGGRIPYGDVVNDTWGPNKVYTNIARSEIWPKVKELEKVGYWYHNVGDMNPDEIVSFIRRFYYAKIGRGNFLLINLDYLKAFDMDNVARNQSEWQMIGTFIKKLKALITNEIDAGIFTSLQSNKTGIYQGKAAGHINDSEEAFSLSDRILQQSTHGFTMRFKVPEELAGEQGEFGNIKLNLVKQRRLVGPRVADILRPVLLPTGKNTHNYFNLGVIGGFYYEDRGLFSDNLERMGQTTINVDRPIAPGTLV